ncbi:MAG: DUF2892 domain-containing protein [bacterium]
MATTMRKLEVIQNEGLLDRVTRFIIGVVMLGIGVGEMTVTPHITWWEAALVIASVYPILTAILGWDPFYGMTKVRTCNPESGNRNECGSFPYEVDAALGHKPTPDKGSEYDHTLAGSHHETKTSR